MNHIVVLIACSPLILLVLVAPWILRKRKKDLRELCREKYGDEFVNMYDLVNRGIPIGDLEETLKFLEMIEAVKIDEAVENND